MPVPNNQSDTGRFKKFIHPAIVNNDEFETRVIYGPLIRERMENPTKHHGSNNASLGPQIKHTEIGNRVRAVHSPSWSHARGAALANAKVGFGIRGSNKTLEFEMEMGKSLELVEAESFIAAVSCCFSSTQGVGGFGSFG